MDLIRKMGAFFLDMLQVVVFAVSIFLFLYLLVMQPHKIKGNSMQPNYPDGEYLLTDKITYRFNEPKRGDVIVFEAPGGEDEYIKRIIGLPGETISLQSSKVYLNGELLNESYLDANLPTTSGVFLKDGDQITVPTGQYFVLGDNRPYSSDSRSWGFVAKNKIRGRAWFIYWPPQSAGTVEAITY